MKNHERLEILTTKNTKNHEKLGILTTEHTELHEKIETAPWSMKYRNS
jgi:hypothetical protein